MGGEAAAPSGRPPQLDGAGQQQPKKNQPNRPSNQAGMKLLERLTDVLEFMRKGSAPRDTFKAPRYNGQGDVEYFLDQSQEVVEANN